MKVTALLFTLLIQSAIAGLFFIGGLMDPLIDLWLAAIYFVVIGSYAIYRTLLSSAARNNDY